MTWKWSVTLWHQPELWKVEEQEKGENWRQGMAYICAREWRAFMLQSNSIRQRVCQRTQNSTPQEASVLIISSSVDARSPHWQHQNKLRRDAGAHADVSHDEEHGTVTETEMLDVFFLTCLHKPINAAVFFWGSVLDWSPQCRRMYRHGADLTLHKFNPQSNGSHWQPRHLQLCSFSSGIPLQILLTNSGKKKKKKTMRKGP